MGLKSKMASKMAAHEKKCCVFFTISHKKVNKSTEMNKICVKSHSISNENIMSSKTSYSGTFLSVGSEINMAAKMAAKWRKRVECFIITLNKVNKSTEIKII